MLIVFTPAGKMEAFFREVTKANGIPPADPQLWRAHGMELIRPPQAASSPVGEAIRRAEPSENGSAQLR
jgi:hypothetical protein